MISFTCVWQVQMSAVQNVCFTVSIQYVSLSVFAHFCVLQPCFPGLISSEDRVDCRLCPAGFSCDPPHGTLSLCPPGRHSPEGVLQCLTCPVDSVCTSGFPFKVAIKSRLYQFQYFSAKNVLHLREEHLVCHDKWLINCMNVWIFNQSPIVFYLSPLFISNVVTFSVGLARNPM